MKKKYWIASALSTCLMALYWLTDEQTTAAAANIQPANNNEEKRNTPHGERTSLIEVKQALTASALERSNELAFEKALESTLSDRPDQVEDALGSLETNYSQNLTITYISESAHDDATENGKPIINLAVEQQLQTIIYSWELTQNNPINYSLGVGTAVRRSRRRLTHHANLARKRQRTERSQPRANHAARRAKRLQPNHIFGSLCT